MRMQSSACTWSRPARRERLWACALIALVWLLRGAPVRADAVAQPTAPTTDQCIALHVEGQALRVAGSFADAASTLRACLHPACSPLLRADCAALLETIQNETPTVVLAARAKDVDLVDVSVREAGRSIAEHLDGRPVPIDPGPHELAFSAPGMPPVTRSIVVRAGEKNRLVSVVLGAEPGGPAVSVSPPALQSAVPSPGSDAPPARPGFLARITPWDYVLLGASVGLAGAAIGTAVSAGKDAHLAERECKPNCSDGRTHAIQRKAAIADGLFVLSAATLIYVTIRVALRKPRDVSARVLIGPAFVGGRVSF
jgi:hypothetical protein